MVQPDVVAGQLQRLESDARLPNVTLLVLLLRVLLSAQRSADERL